MTTLNPTEHQIQCAAIEWRDLMIPSHPEIRWLHAVPNGFRATPEVGKWMKDEGMTAGVSDLFLPIPKFTPIFHDVFDGYHGLYIEVKTVTGKVTPEQGEFIAFVREQGYRAVVLRSVAAIISEVSEYLGYGK